MSLATRKRPGVCQKIGTTLRGTRFAVGQTDTRSTPAAPEVVRYLGTESLWDVALAADAEPHRRVPSSYVGTVTAAFADFVDLKASHTVGHSARVAELA
jgi:hypothetical protein